MDTCSTEIEDDKRKAERIGKAKGPEEKDTSDSIYNGMIDGIGPAGTTPLPAVTEEYPRLICYS